LCVQEAKNGDELQRLGYRGLIGASRAGTGAKISAGEGTVVIVRVPSCGRQNAEIPADGVSGAAVGGVRHPVYLGAGCRRTGPPESAEASVGFRCQFSGLASRIHGENAIDLVELITEIAWRRVELGKGLGGTKS